MTRSEESVDIGWALIFAVMVVTLIFVSAGWASGTKAPEEAWTKTYSGTIDDQAYSVQQTSDGGFILIGKTQYSADRSNIWLVKTYPDGTGEWSKTFGGPSFDEARSVQQSSDGGYIFAGYTVSSDNRKQVWLVKTYPDGTGEWNRTFGGIDDDWAFSVDQTSDEGYILAGGTYSYGAGWADVWLVKTESNGDRQWSKFFGGTDSEEAYSVQQTADGGYILTGYTESYGAGKRDAWLLKTYSNGTEEWNMTFGGKEHDWAYSVRQTDDGYILVGSTSSYGHGQSDVWLLKTYPNGTEEWNMTFGYTNYDEGYSVRQTADGGYIIAGSTKSYGAGGSDAWLLKTNSNGDELWNRTFGGSYADWAYSVQQTTDRGYILAGYTWSFRASSYDFWLIKVKAEGDHIFDTGYGTYPSLPGTCTGEFIPAYDLKVTKLYTYPCAGTGGHAESIELREGNNNLIAKGTWNGYHQSDWHNITLNNETGIADYVTLLKGHKYNYIIRTGSYPQIIHLHNVTNDFGTITCSSFTDTNGNTCNDWIPAIRLV
ncbi:MAG: hypothetical protein WAV32_05280 [Halobacteriota archaeon]